MNGIPLDNIRRFLSAGTALSVLCAVFAAASPGQAQTRGNAGEAPPQTEPTVGVAGEEEAATENAESEEAGEQASAEAEEASPFDKYGSVMMSPRVNDWIRRAIKSYETKIPVAVLMPDVFPTDIYDPGEVKDIPPSEPIEEPKLTFENLPKSEIVQKVLPPPIIPQQITFNSFVRIGPKEWVAWLNGEKVSSRKAEDAFAESNITIKRMREERLFFVWEDSQIERILPEWQSNMARIGDTDFYTNGKNIIVDEYTGKVGFFLNPGESFSGERLLVFAGDMPPDAAAGAALDALPGAENADAREQAVMAAVRNLRKQTAQGDEDIMFSGGTLTFGDKTQAPAADTAELAQAAKTALLPEFMNAKDRKHLLTLYAILIR